MPGPCPVTATRVGYGCYMRVRTKPDKRDEFVRLIAALRSNVRAHEPGTLVFEFFQGADPNEFVFFEGFVDESAQQRHQQAPYHAAMSGEGWACLDGQPIIEFLRPAV
jgi:quinol monooxygenase YgiN